MITDLYFEIIIEKKNPFLAENYILKTESVRTVLEQEYGSSTKGFTLAEQPEVLSKLKNILGEEFEDNLFISDKIVNDLLKHTERFLKDAGLALSLFISTKKQIDQLPILERIPTKFIGKIPVNEYTIGIPQIFAHSFLDALVKTSSTLMIMTNEKKTPYINENTRTRIIDIYNRFNLAFPKIWDVRNSWQHIEDRMRGKGKDEKELNVRMLILSVLENDNLSYTISNGEVHTVNISEQSLMKARDFVQEIWDCFDWVQGVKLY